MVSLSKLLDQGLRDARCQEVFHPGRTCFQFQSDNTLSYLISCMKYFLPIVCVPLVLKGRRLQKKHIKAGLRYYVEAFMTGFLIAQSVPIALCGTRALCGHFTRFNFVQLPGMFTTWIMFFTSARVARLYAATIFQLTLETVLRKGGNPVSRTIAQSKLIQTLMFMTCSAFILHTMRTNSMGIFWFVKSISSPKEGDEDKCTHDGSCIQSVIKELSQMLLISIPLDLFKTFFGGASKDGALTQTLIKKLLSLDFPTTLFLSSYTSLYRLTSCLLTPVWKTNPHLKHVVAAFLGGASFRFLPKQAMLCYATSACIEISWKLFKRYKFGNDNKFVETMKRIPFHRIYSVFVVGYLVHVYVFRVHLLSPLGVTVISAITGNQAPAIKKGFQQYCKRFEN